MNLVNSLILSTSILGFGFFMGKGLQKFNRSERAISVRGLAEKEVLSNVAVLKINFNVSSDKIDDVRRNLPVAQQTVQNFLLKNGFEAAEIVKSSSIKDRQAQDYGGEKGNRFVATSQFTVTTKKVDNAEKTEQKIDELLKAGLVVTNNQTDFYFTDLNQIKPEMLDEATKNAKQAAQGFAKSMDVGVGEMKSASQGVFSVENTIDGGSGGEFGGNSTLKKKVRVVTQIEFYIN